MHQPTAPTSPSNGRPYAGRSARRWAAVLIGVAALAATAGPASATTVETTHFGGTIQEASVNPCSGEAGTFQVTFTGVSHTTINADGSIHHVATVHGTEAFDPANPGVPSYSGRFTARDGQSGAEGETTTSSAAFHDTLFGSDGSKISVRGVFHLTIHADGTVSSSIDRVTLTCP
jgi:hypothetical protein